MHELKIWPEHFEPVLLGHKVAELRKNDRDFREGDLLHFREWIPETNPMTLNEGHYTGRDCHCVILHVTTSPPVQDGLALISMARAGLSNAQVPKRIA